MGRFPTTSSVIAVVFIVACIVISCTAERSIAPEIGSVVSEPTYLPSTSPDNVLENLARAHERRDIDGYAACFAETFVFVPSPTDGLRFALLTREEDLASTRRMFQQAERIEMTLVPGETLPSDRLDLPAREGYLQTVATASIRITIPSEGTEPEILQVNGDPAYFVFEPADEDGEITYRIVRQEDRH